MHRSTPSIAVYGNGGAPYHHLAVLSRAGYDVSVVFAEEVRAGVLPAFDAFVVPGGGYEGCEGQLEPLGESGAAAVTEFVQAGGMYLGSCAGAYDAASPAIAFQASCPPQRWMGLLPARVWNEDAEPWSGLQSPGVGRIRVRNSSPQHPIMSRMPPEFDIVHYNGPLFTGAEALISVLSPTQQFTPSEGFLSTTYGEPTMIRRAANEGVSAAVVGRSGSGRVALFGCHPEFGFSLGMDDEQAPARMLLNAIDWQMDEAGARGTRLPALFASSADSTVDSQSQLAATLKLIRSEVSSLQKRSLDRPWIERRYAMSVFGKSPSVVWEQSLSRILELVAEVEVLGPALPANLLCFAPLPEWHVDFGFHGVLALLSQAGQMLSLASARWDADLEAASEGPHRSRALGDPDPYAFIRTSPYHLVAGSYLAAIGRVAAAALLCRCRPGRVNGNTLA